MAEKNGGNGFGIRFLFENSLFLIGGALAALLWANWGAGYHQFVEAIPIAAWPHVTTHFLVNDVLMALFFGIAAKEVWESFLPGGALSDFRKAATPIMATLGGVIMPALIYLGLVLLTGQNALIRGWAVPCATDIAFSYMVARIIFGKSHPAIAFLLLLAIADDGIGLAILTIAYPQHALHPEWMLLIGAAVLVGMVFSKVLKLHSFWWYLLVPGIMSWAGFYWSGLHAALALVPIVPTMPHAKSDLGLFMKEELGRHDTLNEFEHWWKNPVELILGMFGLVNAGVAFTNVGLGSGIVLAGLLVGKPVGILLFSWAAVRIFRFDLPSGMNFKHVATLGTVAGIGFTVALFVTTAAFGQPGPIQDAVKMGALGSFLAAPLAFLVAKVLKIKPVANQATPNMTPELAAVESH